MYSPKIVGSFLMVSYIVGIILLGISTVVSDGHRKHELYEWYVRQIRDKYAILSQAARGFREWGW